MFITMPEMPVFSPKTRLLKRWSIIMSALPEMPRTFIITTKYASERIVITAPWMRFLPFSSASRKSPMQIR